MVEVNMGQEQMGQLIQAEPQILQVLFQLGLGRTRTAFNQHKPIWMGYEIAGDRLWATQEFKVKDLNGR
jgi:hypothetical protein